MADPDGSDLSKEEVRQKVSKLEEEMRRHVSLAAFCRPPATTPEDVIDNGMASFLHLPGGKFIATNWHVWTAFQEHRDNDPNFKLAVMGSGFRQPVDISDAEEVDKDRELDIAILAYPAERIEEIGKSYLEPTPWPPVQATQGEDIAVVGFPGTETCAVWPCFHRQRKNTPRNLPGLPQKTTQPP